jgi:formylglycine-generating enzyme required for sulfatase activity
MAIIPGGSFDMGYEKGEIDEGPIHTVELSGFEIGKYEITNHQFSIFVRATRYRTIAHQDNSLTWEDFAGRGRNNHPAIMITWEDAMEYCNWLSKMTGETYRLPTEAEWEYAARGGMEERSYPWGDDFDLKKANCLIGDFGVDFFRSAVKSITQVGSFEPNGYGLYDVIGNVSEWCYDWYEKEYYDNSEEKNPMGPESGIFEYRVTRGGSWADPYTFCRVSFRNAATLPFRCPSVGFRVLKVVKPAPATSSQ